MDTSNKSTDADSSSGPSKWVLRLVSLGWGVVLLPALLFSMMSAMLFDAPGSEKSVLTILFALCVATTPLTLIASSIGGFIISSKKDVLSQNPLRAKMIMILPLVHIVTAVTLFLLIDFVCNGELSC